MADSLTGRAAPTLETFAAGQAPELQLLLLRDGSCVCLMPMAQLGMGDLVGDGRIRTRRTEQGIPLGLGGCRPRIGSAGRDRLSPSGFRLTCGSVRGVISGRIMTIAGGGMGHRTSATFFVSFSLDQPLTPLATVDHHRGRLWLSGAYALDTLEPGTPTRSTTRGWATGSTRSSSSG